MQAPIHETAVIHLPCAKAASDFKSIPDVGFLPERGYCVELERHAESKDAISSPIISLSFSIWLDRVTIT